METLNTLENSLTSSLQSLSDVDPAISCPTYSILHDDEYCDITDTTATTLPELCHFIVDMFAENTNGVRKYFYNLKYVDFLKDIIPDDVDLTDDDIPDDVIDDIVTRVEEICTPENLKICQMFIDTLEKRQKSNEYYLKLTVVPPYVNDKCMAHLCGIYKRGIRPTY